MARYNYIFSHDDPRRKQPYRGGVRIVETGETFSSIAEAARVYGIDASNIAKVLRGQRKTAGGYHFEKAEKKYDVPQDPRETLRKQIREKIRKANKIIKRAREQKREGFLENVSELDDFGRDVVGATGDNYIDETSDILDDMDEDELKTLDEKLDKMIESAEEDMKKSEDRLQEYADLFGISSAEMEKYEGMIPDINRTIERAKAFGIGSDVFEQIKELMQDEISPDSLKSFIDKINEFFDDPGRFKSYFDALQGWEFQTTGGKTWEDMENSGRWFG